MKTSELKKQNGKKIKQGTALRWVRRILTGANGKERNGIMIPKVDFEKVMGGELQYFADVPTTCVTLVCCEGQFGWLENHKPYTGTLEEQISEGDAWWILMHGIFRQGAGEV